MDIIRAKGVLFLFIIIDMHTHNIAVIAATTVINNEFGNDIASYTYIF